MDEWYKSTERTSITTRLIQVMLFKSHYPVAFCSWSSCGFPQRHPELGSCTHQSPEIKTGTKFTRDLALHKIYSVDTCSNQLTLMLSFNRVPRIVKLTSKLVFFTMLGYYWLKLLKKITLQVECFDRNIEELTIMHPSIRMLTCSYSHTWILERWEWEGKPNQALSIYTLIYLGLEENVGTTYILQVSENEVLKHQVKVSRQTFIVFLKFWPKEN